MAAAPRPDPCARPRPADEDPLAVRAVVVQSAARIPDVLPRLRGLSANTLVTHASPDPATAEAAREAHAGYIAWMTTAEIERTVSDRAAADRIRSLRGLTGIYYEDDAAVEGYTSPQDQELAYRRLKSLRPDVLVLHPLRLDPIAWDPGYLSRVFRPEFTDMLVPYFYPVGSTVLGSLRDEDPWEQTLVPLLREVARIAPRKPVLAVFQAFEQVGYPVGSRLLSRQLEAYRSVWPELDGVALFEWGFSADDTPLVGMGFRPEIAAAARVLFRDLALEERAFEPCVPLFRGRGR